MKQNLNTRDYSVSEIKEDIRIIHCRIESLVALILAALAVILPQAITQLPQWGDIAEYKYLFGMPFWFTIAYLSLIACCVVAVIYTVFGIKDEPLDEQPGENTDVEGEDNND